MALDCDFSDAINALSQLGKRVESKVTKEALKDGAEVILKAERSTVPIGDTGRLKKSLGVGKTYTKKRRTYIHIGILNAQEREVVYGYYQHYGTRRMLGKFWIDTAWKMSKEEAKEVMKSSLIRIVKGK